MLATPSLDYPHNSALDAHGGPRSSRLERLPGTRTRRVHRHARQDIGPESSTPSPPRDRRWSSRG